MTSRLRRTLLASALTTAMTGGLTLASATAAQAQDWSHVDQTSDVRSMDMNSTSEVSVPQPTVKQGDVVRVGFSHGARRISVRMRLAELSPSGDGTVHFVRVVTDEGIVREVGLYASAGMWRGQAEMTNRSGATVKCQITHAIDYKANTVSVSFPRSCASDPRWVKLGAATVRIQGSTAYADDAQLNNGVGNYIRLSPRLTHG